MNEESTLKPTTEFFSMILYNSDPNSKVLAIYLYIYLSSLYIYMYIYIYIYSETNHWVLQYDPLQQWS